LLLVDQFLKSKGKKILESAALPISVSTRSWILDCKKFGFLWFSIDNRALRCPREVSHGVEFLNFVISYITHASKLF
jgi:hypothetical protein